MSGAELIIRLIIVVLLTTYLVIKRRHRMYKEPPTEDSAIWTGRGIDATTLRPTLDRVRDDYLAAHLSSVRDIGYHGGLLTLMAQAIRRLSFFQKRKPEENAQKHVS